MASDYARICADNKAEYGNVGRWGQPLLANRYDDRTHFIYELLQNTEDALFRRGQWTGARAVTFHLTNEALCVTHFGKPFDEGDVRAICGIAESTKDKDLTQIGRFGIGFKSVYAFTDRPEVHSGEEDFAIDSYVMPAAVAPLARDKEATVILLPLKTKDDRQAIADGLNRLGARTLLFLRQVEEVKWQVDDGGPNRYIRSTPEILADGVRRIVVTSQPHGRPTTSETWLIFCRKVIADNSVVRNVEIAFSTVMKVEENKEIFAPIAESPLVAFFPTVLDTRLGFLVQGPYRTTPSRDNVPRSDPWNQYLVRETATLLGEALRKLRELNWLDTNTIRCLPLDPTHFGETRMFAPLFEATKQLLKSEPLLPRFGGGHESAANVRIARSQELRNLFSSQQLGRLFLQAGDLFWLSADITQERTPQLRQYLMRELEIAEITPATILPSLTRAFLEEQSDDWVLHLYEFFGKHPGLVFSSIPLIRLKNGRHVTVKINGSAQVFFPGTGETDFPTVRPAVCATTEARRFLQSIGLTEPDAVDDIVGNILPKYQVPEIDIPDAEYESDIKRILSAYLTDSKMQRERLLSALRATSFVMAVNAGDGSEYHLKPAEVYLATDRLNALFSGIDGVALVDDRYECLRGEDIGKLLEACGAERYLKPIQVVPDFSEDKLRKLRAAARHEQTSNRNDKFLDWTLGDIDEILNHLRGLEVRESVERARLLWEALYDVATRRGQSFFTGTYFWTHYGDHSWPFPSTFVRLLNEAAWVPDAKGLLSRPEFVAFDSLGWKTDPFLQSKIHFRPAVIESLAKEAGIDPGLLDLLKKLGVTSAEGLRSKFGIVESPPPKQHPVIAPAKGGAVLPANGGQESDKTPPLNTATLPSVPNALKDFLGNAPAPTPPISDPRDTDSAGRIGTGVPRTGIAGGTVIGGGAGPGGAGGGAKSAPGAGGNQQAAGHTSPSGPVGGKRSAGSTGGRPFISYVAVQPDHEEQDPDELDHAARMTLEDQAIAFILATEPTLQRTPTNNSGFDLVEPDANDQPVRWVEVKAMTGSLHDRPVTLSRNQFDCARAHGAEYWLYVVEHAGSDSARLVRIQDPAGKARTFTFDHGWLAVAAPIDNAKHQEG